MKKLEYQELQEINGGNFLEDLLIEIVEDVLEEITKYSKPYLG